MDCPWSVFSQMDFEDSSFLTPPGSPSSPSSAKAHSDDHQQQNMMLEVDDFLDAYMPVAPSLYLDLDLLPEIAEIPNESTTAKPSKTAMYSLLNADFSPDQFDTKSLTTKSLLEEDLALPGYDGNPPELVSLLSKNDPMWCGNGLSVSPCFTDSRVEELVATRAAFQAFESSGQSIIPECPTESDNEEEEEEDGLSSTGESSVSSVESLDYSNPVTREHSYHMRIPANGSEVHVPKQDYVDVTISPPETDEEVDVVTVSDVAASLASHAQQRPHGPLTEATRFAVASHYYTGAKHMGASKGIPTNMSPASSALRRRSVAVGASLSVLNSGVLGTSTSSRRILGVSDSVSAANSRHIHSTGSLLANNNNGRLRGRGLSQRASARGYSRQYPVHQRESEGRGSQHNELERKRRNDLKDNFRSLRKLVPSLTHNEKASKVMILDSATVFSRDLVQKEKSLTNELAELQARRSALRRQLEALRAGSSAPLKSHSRHRSNY